MNSFLKSVTFAAIACFALTASAAFESSSFNGHLAFKQNTLHVYASFQTPPVVGQDSILTLEMKDPRTHQAIEISDVVDVVLWMPSMGHGSAPTQVERAVDANGGTLAGAYKVRNVFFIMPGDWEIRVSLTDSLGLKETKSFEIILPGSGHGGHH